MLNHFLVLGSVCLLAFNLLLRSLVPLILDPLYGSLFFILSELLPLYYLYLQCFEISLWCGFLFLSTVLALAGYHLQIDHLQFGGLFFFPVTPLVFFFCFLWSFSFGTLVKSLVLMACFVLLSFWLYLFSAFYWAFFAFMCLISCTNSFFCCSLSSFCLFYSNFFQFLL